MKPGYKQTEVGVIPEDWESKKLEEYFSFISYGFTNPMPTVDHGVFMVTAADINDGRLQLETARKTTETAYRTFLTPKSKPKKDDILLTKDGSLGRLALVGDEQICINQSVAIIRPNEKVEALFLKLLLESPIYQRKMIDDAGGSTIKHIYITIVNLMPLGLPPDRTEQRAIATALSDVDGLLGSLDRLIAKKRDLKQAAMQQLLTGQTRLPGFTGKWETKRLGECSRFCPGTYLAQDAYQNGEFEVQGAGNAMGKHNAANFPDPISVIGRVGTVGRPRFMPNGCWVNNNAAAIVAIPNQATPKFAHLLIQTMDWSKATSVTAQPFLVVESLMKVEFKLPPLPEQTAIATVLSDMDLELAALEQRRDKTRALKQGMMQELLTGRTRLVSKATPEVKP